MFPVDVYRNSAAPFRRFSFDLLDRVTYPSFDTDHQTKGPPPYRLLLGEASELSQGPNTHRGRSSATPVDHCFGSFFKRYRGNRIWKLPNNSGDRLFDIADEQLGIDGKRQIFSIGADGGVERQSFWTDSSRPFVNGLNHTFPDHL